MEIAATRRIDRDGDLWLVPSTSGKGKYKVLISPEKVHCSCADFELRQRRCKHIWAAEFVHRREQEETNGTNGTAPKASTATESEPLEKVSRPTYSQNWPAYNAAQTNEKTLFQVLLHDLCQGIREPEYTFGRPRLSRADMVFATAFKVYSTFSGRRFVTDLSEAFNKGFITKLPHYNSIFNYLDMKELTPVLRAMVERASLPLKAVETQFAVDSSGFSSANFVRWYNARYGNNILDSPGVFCYNRGMENAAFPQTLIEAIRYFSDADTCFSFMCEIRWPNGVSCPRCQGTELSFISTRKMWKCKECKRQFSVKVGTIMEDSPLGLDKWLSAIWMIANAKNGISSWEIHRALGITQKSAWFLLHRIRLAMKEGSFEKANGTVEVDETFIGGKAKNMHEWKREQKIQGRGATGKAIVAGLLERHDGEKQSKVRTKVVKDTKKDTLQGEVRDHVETGATVYTDALSSYVGLNLDYVHEQIDHAVEYVRGAVHTNGLENYWSLLKRCLGGTYVSVEADHLEKYLDEEAFRFNQRKDVDAGRFVSVMGGVPDRRLTYVELTGRNEPNHTPRRGG